MNKALSPIVSEFATEDEAESYDRWFRAKVEHSLQLAEDPYTRRIPHDEVMARARARIEEKIRENASRNLA